MPRFPLSCLLVAASLIALAAAPARAQSVESFYGGKTVDIYIGYSVGGGFDTYARLLARHIGKHIPGSPAVVPKNMEGAGSLRLANWLYTSAPNDGTVFGTIGPTVPFDPLLGGKGAQFDPEKFSWIGSVNSDLAICVSWHTSGVRTLDDLLTRELTVAGTGPTSDIDPKVINGAFGTKMRLITGYPGGNDMNLAMERGEVGGRCGWSWASIKSTKQQWLDEKKINLLFQMALEPNPELPGVPLVTRLVKTDEQKQMVKLLLARQDLGRPFLAPPNLPPGRLAVLRAAFNATMKDPEFLAEAGRAKLEIAPTAGETLEKLIAEAVSTPPEILKRAVDMINAK